LALDNVIFLILAKKDFTLNRFYSADDIIQAKPISQMHIINLDMQCIHKFNQNKPEPKKFFIKCKEFT